MRTKETTYLLAQAVVVAVVLVLVSLPLQTSNSSGRSATSEQTSTTSDTTGSGTYDVLQENLTVYYGTACMIISYQSFGCPTYNPAEHSPSLSHVDLVDYQGSDYYDINYTQCINADCGVTAIWFTNSTIFCASPANGGYPACPVNPFLPYNVAPGKLSTSSLSASDDLALELQVTPNPNGTAGIEVKVDEFNTLQAVNNVTAANSWPSIRPLSDHMCESPVVDFVMYRGDYAPGNVTAGSTLQLSSPGSTGGCTLSSPPTYFSFQPESDSISAYAGDTSGLQFKTASLSELIEGYWPSGNYSPSATLLPFPPGIYTVVAVDQWGELAILHFTLV